MTAIIVLALLVALAVLAPRFGRDSRSLDDHRRTDTYPALPPTRTR